MSPITQLVSFGLRQVIGDYADGAAQIGVVIEQRFRDHSRTLPKALDQAHHRAWQSLGVALAGDGLLDRVKVFFASGDDKGVREQVQLFLDGNAVSFDGTPADFRRDCLDELQRLRKSGRLSTPEGAHAAIARQAASFQRHVDPQGLVEEARRAVAGVADALAENYPNLARLLRTPTPAGPPLLAAAFCYFFRREVETNDELAHGLFFDGLRQLSASQAKAFGEVGQALASLGGQFDALLEQLGRIEAAVEETHTVAVETHGAVLDMQTELQRFGGEARTLMEQVLLRLGQVGMARGEVRPGNSCSIRGEDERRAVKALLARFRELPAEEQRQAPALLNGLGKLQVGAGDFTEARQTFTEVVEAVGNPTDKAEASFNAYRAALEEKKWDAALSALREAGSHDPQRFAPFPLHRYEPKRILGAGGFGTGVLCLDRHFDENVVVKTLHAADLASGADEVFREARILRRLSHPVIIVVRDCEYADLTHKTRPYLVMDYFPGASLQEFVEQRGPLNLEQLLAVAMQVAEGMKVAHAQGVLHRDLKPANLLVRKEGNQWKVKIIDFGLALRQQTIETSRLRIGADQKSMLDSSVAGTLDYAPPEQMGKLPGVQPGPYSDVYAFARTCCYAMFRTTELRRKQWDSLPRPLADLLEGCLDPDSRQRPKDFEPVLAVLGVCSRGGQEIRLLEQATARRAEEEARQRIIVSAGGDGAYRSISQALKVARPGAEILVRPGVYKKGLVLDKPVSLLGDGPAEQIVIESADAPCILMATDNAIVQGMTLRGTTRPHGKEFFAVDIGQGNLLLERCDITSDSLACVAIHGKHSNPTVRDCKIHDSKGGCGVRVYEQGRGTVEGCDIFANKSASVEISDGGNPIVRDCKIHDNTSSSGVLVGENGKGTVEGCDIFANGIFGNVAIWKGDPTVRDCKIHDNQRGCGMWVLEQSKGTVEGCEIFANKSSGVQIWKGDPTVRDCKIYDNEQAGVVVCAQGKGTVERCDIFANKFSGVEIKMGGDPTVVVIESAGDPTIRDCKIHDNEQAGVHVLEQGKGTVEGCDIFANKFSGVAIGQGSDPTVRSCRISGNGYKAVSAHEEGRGTVEGCDLRGNKQGAWSIAPGCQVRRKDNQE
jgi:F-box protein 11